MTTPSYGNWSRKVKAKRLIQRKHSVCKGLRERVLTLLTFGHKRGNFNLSKVMGKKIEMKKKRLVARG